MQGNMEMAAALRIAIGVKATEIRQELRELGAIHREYLATPGRCSCSVAGSTERCAVADTLERGTEELSGQPMPPAAGSCFN